MTNAEKLAAAIKELGPRWVLHESRRIQRGSYIEPHVMRCNVAETFERVRARVTTTQIIRVT